MVILAQILNPRLRGKRGYAQVRPLLADILLNLLSFTAEFDEIVIKVSVNVTN